MEILVNDPSSERHRICAMNRPNYKVIPNMWLFLTHLHSQVPDTAYTNLATDCCYYYTAVIAPLKSTNRRRDSSRRIGVQEIRMVVGFSDLVGKLTASNLRNTAYPMPKGLRSRSTKNVITFQGFQDLKVYEYSNHIFAENSPNMQIMVGYSEYFRSPKSRLDWTGGCTASAGWPADSTLEPPNALP